MLRSAPGSIFGGWARFHILSISSIRLLAQPKRDRVPFRVVVGGRVFERLSGKRRVAGCCGRLKAIGAVDGKQVSELAVGKREST